MIVNIYSVKDNQVDSFAQPFTNPTHGAALRAFADHVNEPGTAANRHPADFSLYHLGTFNDTDGHIEAVKPTRIGTAAEYLKKEANK